MPINTNSAYHHLSWPVHERDAGGALRVWKKKNRQNKYTVDLSLRLSTNQLAGKPAVITANSFEEAHQIAIDRAVQYAEGLLSSLREVQRQNRKQP